MNRRAFLYQMGLSAGAPYLPSYRQACTKHLIFIVNGGGVRKADYYEREALAPNLRKLSSEGFVFEEDHCERVASHDAAFDELVGAHTAVAEAPRVPSLRTVPGMMEKRRPRILVCRERAHDVGHESYESYLSAVRATDAAIGKVFEWVKSHAYFSQNTAIVVRPEFGRDDEVNANGHLHHSYGFYYTHRVASIFWGPDINRGIDKQTVIRSVDIAPTLAKIVGAGVTTNRILPGLLKT